MNHALTSSIAALLWACASQAGAQSAPSTNRDNDGPSKREQASASPEADLRSGLPPLGLSLLADSDTASVALILSGNWDSPGATNTISGKLSTALDPEGGGRFITDDGPTKGTNLQLGYARVWTTANLWNPKASSAALLQILIAARKRCVEKKVAQEDKKWCEAETTDSAKLAEFMTNEDRELIKDLAYETSPFFFFGATGTVGYRRFDHRSPLDLAERQADRTTFSIGANVGIMPPQSLVYLGGGFQYKRDYVEATKRTLCGPPPPTGPQECFTAAFQEPVKKITASLFGVARWQGEIRDIPLGLQVMPAYDFQSEVPAVTVTLYTFANKDRTLRGGVALKWQGEDNNPLTDDDEFAASLFVGAPFSVFGSP